MEIREAGPFVSLPLEGGRDCPESDRFIEKIDGTEPPSLTPPFKGGVFI